MTSRALLDTDMFSEAMRGRSPKVAANAKEYRRQFGHFTISTISLVELIKGLVRVSREDQIVQLEDHLRNQEVLPLDAVAAVLAGRIYGELERSGQTIGRIDPIIAAVALRHGLTLVTGNTEHFQRIADLGFPLKLANCRL